MSFTRFIVTHVSILTSDFSSNICRYTFDNLQNVLLPLVPDPLMPLMPLMPRRGIGHWALEEDGQSRRFGNLLEPRYIFGAI